MRAINTRIGLLESKRKLTQMPLVLFYRSADGLSRDQLDRINAAKQSGRQVRLIRTFVSGNE